HPAVGLAGGGASLVLGMRVERAASRGAAGCANSVARDQPRGPLVELAIPRDDITPRGRNGPAYTPDPSPPALLRDRARDLRPVRRATRDTRPSPARRDLPGR